MRLTPSSSLLLATLALSSSSSSLAAPTDGQGLADHDLLSSSSSGAISARGDSTNLNMGVGDTRIHLGMHSSPEQVARPVHGMHPVHDRRQLEGLLNTIEGLPLLGPILGNLIQTILAKLGLQQTGGVTALDALSPEQIAQVQQAVSQAANSVAAALPSLPPLPVSPPGGVPNASRRAVARDDSDPQDASSTASGSTYWSSATPSFGALALPTPPIDPPVPLPDVSLIPPVSPPVSPPVPSGLNPLSPPIPANPPNTPVPPPAARGIAEALGVPAGAPAPPAPPAVPLTPPVSPPVSPPVPPKPANGTASPPAVKAQSEDDGSDAPPLFASASSTGSWSTAPTATDSA
ncbi:hypothetical protein AcV7_001049 [Taiwanofungus camphoratus]|nr:hypothetical protein AcV7_001049 [Antrodia cinnamomea]